MFNYRLEFKATPEIFIVYDAAKIIILKLNVYLEVIYFNVSFVIDITVSYKTLIP